MSTRGVWGDQQLPLFILGPLHISVTNVARELKFGARVGVFTSTSVLYKNFSAGGHVGGTAAPNLYFKTPSISPELIELKS